jgi:hypothetical protein
MTPRAQQLREQLLAWMQLTKRVAASTLGYLTRVAEELERRGRQGRRRSVKPSA